MTKLRLVLILILTGSLGTLGYFQYQEYRDREQRSSLSPQVAALMKMAAEQRSRQATQLFFDAATYQIIPTAYPRPVSRWTANEKRFYEKILVASNYDVLVAPLQVDGPAAFDRASRSLMTAELAAAIAKTQRGTVSDTFLMEKVLGEGQRQFPEDELYRVANLVGAKRIIWGAIGHDQKGKMSVTILSQLRPADATVNGKWSTPILRHWIAGIAFDAVHPPIDVFALQIPESLKAIDIDPTNLSASRIGGKLDLAELPASPMGLLTDGDNPARDAYTFLLFGALTPANMERTKERFAEKAYLAISRLAVDASDYRALRARAYTVLGYRAAAILALGTPASIEEKEIAAMLNGNLPEVRALASREANPLKRLLAELDANRIGADYDVLTSSQSLDAVKELHLPGTVWPFLAARAFTDWDVWSEFDNGSLKRVIDHELPIPGYSFDELARGAMAVGDSEKLDSLLSLSVFNHTQTYVAAHATHCCDPPSTRSSALDYMELLSAMGHDNLIRQMNKLANVQGLNRRAIQFADAIQTVYDGYPYFDVVHGEVENRASASADGAKRDGLLKSAYEHVFNAMYREQTQSRISARALYDLGAYLRKPEYGFFGNFYHTDLPFHPLYITWASGDDAQTRVNGLAALGNATSEYGAVQSLLGDDKAKNVDNALIAEVVRQIQGRFIGNPARGKLLATQETQHGDTAAAEALLRENITMNPEYRDSYVALGTLEFEAGKVDAAAKTFLAYPGLRKDSTADRVMVANTAFDMGQLFYGAGDLDLATKFLKISQSQQTGANAEMNAKERLRLLAGDIDGALSSTLESTQRYHDARSYRDYFGMLHAMKHSQEAWAGFTTVVRELHDPHIWETAMVGHHMAGSSEADVSKWALRSEFQSTGNHYSNALTYLARFATTDRIPSRELATAIADLDHATWQFDTGAHSVVRPDADATVLQVLGPAGAVTGDGVLSAAYFDQGGPKHRVRSDSSFFVAGYRALNTHEYPEAKRVFDEAGSLYDMASPPTSYMLPYYALASARAGADVSNVEAVLSRMGPPDQRFDYQLTEAVLEASRGKISEALVSLKLARYRRPGTDERLALTQYTYGDICESLYHLTGHGEFREVALDWARSREKVEPWHSWSYALEAALTADPVQRAKAIAMAYYLDPKSAHLAEFKRSEIDDAVKSYSKFNIFLKAEHHEVGETTT